jgi:hypothetical protein
MTAARTTCPRAKATPFARPERSRQRFSAESAAGGFQPTKSVTAFDQQSGIAERLREARFDAKRLGAGETLQMERRPGQ